MKLGTGCNIRNSKRIVDKQRTNIETNFEFAMRVEYCDKAKWSVGEIISNKIVSQSLMVSVR